MSRLDIVDNQPTYIRAETQSPLIGFIDDNEFYIDEEAGVIHIRAAARLGQSDLNKNRERMDSIRAAFNSGQWLHPAIINPHNKSNNNPH